MTSPIKDPIRHAAELVAPNEPDALERRMKQDIFASIGRIKPERIKDVDFDQSVMQGDFFATLPPPLQGIAIARTEGVLAFYNRVGWRAAFLEEPLGTCVDEQAQQTLRERYHARTLHDLAYVHPKHFEKMLDKAGAASLWERLKRFVDSA